MEKDKRLLEQYQTGESAKRALYYLEDYFDTKRSKLTRQMMDAPSEDVAIAFWHELKMLSELQKNINLDIQTGELAIKEMEEND